MRRWLALAFALVATMVGFLLRHQRDALDHTVAAPPPPPASHGRPPATAAIEGTVRDDKGQPSAGARVCGAAVDLVCAAGERDGRYRLASLAPGAYEITATARGHEPTMYRDARARPRTPGVVGVGQQRGGIDLVLPAGGVELTGTVVDIGGGPIVHARGGRDLVRTRCERGESIVSVALARRTHVIHGGAALARAGDRLTLAVADSALDGGLGGWSAVRGRWR